MNLDKYQKEVVTSNNNILVIAGPGSGKTTTILFKVDYLIKNNNINPKDILLISFTNNSVNDIKSKIKDNIMVTTFHSLAISILKHNNIEFKLVNKYLLDYIIDEYILTLEKKEKDIVLRYLNTIKLNNSSKEYLSFKKLIKTFINLYKTNYNNIDVFNKIIDNNKDHLLITIIINILRIYEEEKRSTNTLDFDDIIIYASNVLKNNYNYYKYKYIIVDEFQDTSLIRLNLIKAIYDNCNSIITAVGDDAQSIYRFSGCDLNIFLNFNNYFKDAKLLFLKYTYRYSQELINISENFINKNNIQIKKNMISNINDNKPLVLIYYYNAKRKFKKILEEILLISNKILIISRNYFDIYKYIDSSFSLNNDILTYKNNNIAYSTVHKAKGLESEYVIVLNMEDSLYGLPSKLENHYLLDYLTTKSNYKYDEERRIFFVAITRSKKKTYLLIPKNNPSIFIKEIKKLL